MSNMQKIWLILFSTCSTAIMERGVEVERIKERWGKEEGWMGVGGQSNAVVGNKRSLSQCEKQGK